MVQNLIVALIVAAAALYALWRWVPGPWRRRGKAAGCASCNDCGACGSSSAANKLGER